MARFGPKANVLNSPKAMRYQKFLKCFYTKLFKPFVGPKKI